MTMAMNIKLIIHAILWSILIFNKTWSLFMQGKYAFHIVGYVLLWKFVIKYCWKHADHILIKLVLYIEVQTRSPHCRYFGEVQAGKTTIGKGHTTQEFKNIFIT